MPSPARRLRELSDEACARVAPAGFNPLSAKLAAGAGFDLIYLGGGTIDTLECCFEAWRSSAPR